MMEKHPLQCGECPARTKERRLLGTRLRCCVDGQIVGPDQHCGLDYVTLREFVAPLNDECNRKYYL